MRTYESVEDELRRRRMNITDDQIAAVSLPAHKPDTPVVKEVGHKIKCLRTLKELVKQECIAFAAPTPEWELVYEFFKIVSQTLDLEVRRQFSALADRPYEIYDGWMIGPQETGDSASIPLVGLGKVLCAYVSPPATLQ